MGHAADLLPQGVVDQNVGLTKVHPDEVPNLPARIQQATYLTFGGRCAVRRLLTRHVGLEAPEEIACISGRVSHP